MELKVTLCGAAVAVEGDDDLCLEIIQRGEETRIVVDNEVGHELP